MFKTNRSASEKAAKQSESSASLTGLLPAISCGPKQNDSEEGSAINYGSII
jgi:hypothetical protein